MAVRAAYTYPFILPFFLLISLLPVRPHAATITINNGGSLQDALDAAADNDTIIIGEGTFSAESTSFIDSLCGNCAEHRTPVGASYGFLVKDKSLHIKGTDRTKSVLSTNSGYGLFFVNSQSSTVENLTITDGRRDPDGMATDAAVVVRNSGVELCNLHIIDNNHRIDSLVIGIAGVVGREGAEIIISRCNIINNGWDGVALYRGAVANISDCLIKDGRGAGIGVTWDASCTAYRNIVTGYWKGIGAFGTSWVAARNNAVYDNLGWGIIATGQAYMNICNNIVYHNGNCGVGVWSTECHGRIINNIITDNGWKDFWVCPCVGVYNEGYWSKWDFSYNIVWNNKEGNYHNIWDNTDINGNLSIDPMIIGETIFILESGSPAIDAGHPEISDLDGTRSDIGLYGGPQAKKP